MSAQTPLLCIAGGGTGGHVYPALALADAVRKQWPDVEVNFIGAQRGLEAQLLPERDENVLLLNMHRIQGATLASKLKVLLWELPGAVFRIMGAWRTRKPALVVGVGGYASVAGVVAAIIRRIPVVLYEQNAIPGLVNRKLAYLCNRIMLGFPDAARFLPEQKCVATGNIIPEAIRNTRWQAHTPPRLLVMGGSQGAACLNEMLPECCRLLAMQGLEFSVTHVCGPENGRMGSVQAAYREAKVAAEILGYCHDMPAFYAKGDLLVARSGAMTVGEAASCGMPAIFIPLPSAADNHQYYNARALSDAGAALTIEQGHASPALLAGHIKRLLFAPRELERMSKAATTAVGSDAKERQLAVVGQFLKSGKEAVQS